MSSNKTNFQRIEIQDAICRGSFRWPLLSAAEVQEETIDNYAGLMEGLSWSVLGSGFLASLLSLGC